MDKVLEKLEVLEVKASSEIEALKNMNLFLEDVNKSMDKINRRTKWFLLGIILILAASYFENRAVIRNNNEPTQIELLYSPITLNSLEWC